MHDLLIVHTDGAARGNPGPAGIGVVIESDTGEVVQRIARAIGRRTNNQAEYEAVIAGLTAAHALQRQRDRHFVTGMLARTARAISPDFERKLLLRYHLKAEPYEEQRLAGEAEHDLEPQGASVDEE